MISGGEYNLSLLNKCLKIGRTYSYYTPKPKRKRSGIVSIFDRMVIALYKWSPTFPALWIGGGSNGGGREERGWFCTSSGQVREAPFAQAAGICVFRLRKWSFMHECTHPPLVQMEFCLLSDFLHSLGVGKP